MTTRLFVLLVLAGGLTWLRLAMLRRRRADAGRGAKGLPSVPAALRGGGAAWIIFTTPVCAACGNVEQILQRARPGERVVLVDATTDPELADRWDIRRAPTTLRAEADGTVSARLVGVEAVREHVGAGAGVADSEPLNR